MRSAQCHRYVDAACAVGCRTHPPELEAWTAAYVERRYGPAAPSRAAAAWRVLARTLYSCGDAHNNHAADVPTSRPGLTHAEAGQWSSNPQLWYNPAEVSGRGGRAAVSQHARVAWEGKGHEQGLGQGRIRMGFRASAGAGFAASVAAPWSRPGRWLLTCLLRSQVQAAWQQLLAAADEDSAVRHRSTFQYDVVDIGRQVRPACSRCTHPSQCHVSQCPLRCAAAWSRAAT